MSSLLWLAAFPTEPSPSATPAQFGANVFTQSFLLSVLVWSPVAAAVILSLFPNPRGRHSARFRAAAFWVLAGHGFLSLLAYVQFQFYAPGLQFEEKVPWLPGIGAVYHLGLDGIGMAMLLLVELVGLAAILASAGVRERVREYMVLVLLAHASMVGVVVARDLFVMVLFWSAGVAPLGLLVLGWGGAARRRAAARFFAYWGIGSAAFIAAALMLYAGLGAVGFDLDYVLKSSLSPRLQLGVGAALVVVAATRLPLVPFQGWARDVLATAPPGLIVLLVGSASRLGGYVLIRVMVAGLHDGSRLLAPFLGALGFLTIVYAALAVFRARDVRTLGAYLALIPGGVTLLGIAALNPVSLDGAVLSLFAGGIAAAAAAAGFATVAQRAQSASLEVLSGLAGRMPVLTWLLVVACLGLLGVPLLASFPAYLMIFYGSLQSQPAWAFAAGLGLLLSAASIAWVLHRVMFSAPNPDAPAVLPGTTSQTWYLGILVGALIWVGIAPSGPKLGGIPFIFDPGLVPVVNASTADLAAPYVNPSPGP
jgi:proton-translocating NADH-quinone oxidoreductase chain M